MAVLLFKLNAALTLFLSYFVSDIVPGLFWFMIIGKQMISTSSLFTNSPYPFVLNDVYRTKTFRNLEYNVAFR